MAKRPELAVDVLEQLGGPDASPVVVAVSGGSDSVALLHLMNDRRDEGRLPPLHVAHLNHGIRDVAADADARFVEDLADALALPVTIETVDVGAHSRERRISMEHAARECRYAFLERVARDVGARWVALGHTADDQLETVLHHILRGTGIHGLAGMPPMRPIARDSDIAIARPLLHRSRSELVDWLEHIAQTWQTDHTNLDTTYTRNRIRHRLIPALERAWHDIRADVVAFTREMRELDDLLAARATAWVDRNADDAVSVSDLAARDEPLLSYVIRDLIARTLGDLRRIDAVHVRMIIDLAMTGHAGSSLDLPRGLVVSRHHDRMTFRRKNRTGAFLSPHAARVSTTHDALADATLPVPGEVVWGGRRLRTELIGTEQVGPLHAFIAKLRQTDPDGVEYLDFDKLNPSELYIRSRRPGDRLTPLGSTGRRKLKDFFISRHVPRGERDLVPLICAGDKILVVVGLGVDNYAALTDDTRRLLRITTLPETPQGETHD